MALFPASGPRPTSSEAERIFFRALLAGLPKGWTAWHSLRVREGLSAGERYAVRMHVALTRATLAAVVVGTRAEIEADPNLSALAGAR